MKTQRHKDTELRVELRFGAILRSVDMRFRLVALAIMALMSLPAFAQMDPTGEWAPRFHEDNPERLAESITT